MSYTFMFHSPVIQFQQVTKKAKEKKNVALKLNDGMVGFYVQLTCAKRNSK